MLPSSLRIATKFHTIKGSFKHSDCFVLKVVSVGGGTKTQFSVSVSKKVTPLAVNRNKIRRRMYSILRKYIDSVRRGSLLFFQAKTKSSTVSFVELQTDVEKLLHTSNLL